MTDETIHEGNSSLLSLADLHTDEKDHEQHEECRIVSRPLILCFYKPNESRIRAYERKPPTFSVLKCAKDFLRCDEQVDDLPDGEFEIHLTKFQQASQVFVSLRCGAVPVEDRTRRRRISDVQRGGIVRREHWRR